MVKPRIQTGVSRIAVACCGEIRMGGQRITEESKLHINAKELLAAFPVIHYFAAKRQQATLSIHLVNRAAVAYIN